MNTLPIPHMKLTPISKEDLINHPVKDYNPSLWRDTVNRISKYYDAEFYIIEGSKESGFDYPRAFASYVCPDGMHVFNRVDYSASITSNGFCKVAILPDGSLYKSLFRDANGKEGYAENCPENRKKFIEAKLLVSNCI